MAHKEKDVHGVGVYDQSGTAVKSKKSSAWVWIAALVVLAIILVFLFGLF